MSAGLLTRLRPIGAWRFGPPDGSRDRVEPMLHSDSLHAALTWAMGQLGWRSHWLAETAETAEPSVVLTSLFPAFRDQLLVTPPRSAWPPPPSARVRWKGARFVPLAVVRSLLAGEPLDESRWYVEPESECLLPLEKHPSGGPFRVTRRTSIAVDRSGNAVDLRSTACLEFAREGALWCWAEFRDAGARDSWSRRLQSAFRLLADSGVGGERSSGWGHSLPPRFREGDTADVVLADHAEGDAFWWLLSSYNPAPGDGVEWQRGAYSISERSGRVALSGQEKKRVRVVAEGSVLSCANRPSGRAVDVAPEGTGHPVFANGTAVAVRIPAPSWTRSLLYDRMAEMAQQAPAPVPAEEIAPVTEIEPEAATLADGEAAEAVEASEPAETLEAAEPVRDPETDTLESPEAEPPAIPEDGAAVPEEPEAPAQAEADAEALREVDEEAPDKSRDKDYE